MDYSLIPLVTRRGSCRLCDSKDLLLVLPMKPSPIADAFLTLEKKHEKQPLIPLDLYQCQVCGHAQNVDVVNPEVLFRNYIYQTSSSAGLVEHFRKYAREVVKKFDIEPQSLIVEIGSNDGTLLKFFKNLGMRVVGIDPALEIAEQANASGIPTTANFLTNFVAKEIKSNYGLAKLIVANNVYAHTDKLSEMTNAIKSLLNDDGVFVFEVSYLLDIIDKFLFDTIYHEHLSYHSITSFKHFFTLHGLHLFDVELISTKGGSMRCFVQKLGALKKEAPIVEEMIEKETRRGLHQPAIFQRYESEILARKKATQDFVNDALKNKKRIVAYGASTTVITLMYYFELENKFEYLIDDNTRKHGMFSPGSHLEVKPSTMLYTDKPDIVIVMAWQYADAICSKHSKYAADGGIFMVPMPNLRLVEPVTITV